MSKEINGAKVAKNIINRYGIDKLTTLIAKFRSGVPGPEIAKDFGVTRQRVNQWKKALGEEHITFIVFPEVDEMVELFSQSEDNFVSRSKL